MKLQKRIITMTNEDRHIHTKEKSCEKIESHVVFHGDLIKVRLLEHKRL